VGFGAKPSTEKNTCLEGTFLCQTASFEPLCVKISIRLASARPKEKKLTGRKEDVYISRMRAASRSGQISIKFGTCVRLADVIKRAQFLRYNLRGFAAVRC